MCRLYGVTGGGYYAWKRRGCSKREAQDQRIVVKIRSIFEKSRETYGSPRVHQALRLQGVKVGEKRVERLMRVNGLRARSVKIYRRHPGQRRFYHNIENLKLGTLAKLPNQVWVGDVTYLRAGGRRRFLAVVMDRCSRKVIGWSVSNKRDVNLTLKALNQAVHQRRPCPGLLFHTDRGIEYAGFAFRERIAELGFVQSMNRPLRMNDNAHMESFFHSFKSDQYYGKKILSERELLKIIQSYIPFYNQERIHSGLGYLTPVQYEKNLC